MEGFSIPINKTAEGGYLSRFKVKGKGRDFGYSFALCWWHIGVLQDSTNQMVNLKWILFLFEALSWMCINLEKSAITLIGEVEDSDTLTQELGCSVSHLPTTYISLPLGS